MATTKGMRCTGKDLITGYNLSIVRYLAKVSRIRTVPMRRILRTVRSINIRQRDDEARYVPRILNTHADHEAEVGVCTAKCIYTGTVKAYRKGRKSQLRDTTGKRQQSRLHGPGAHTYDDLVKTGSAKGNYQAFSPIFAFTQQNIALC